MVAVPVATSQILTVLSAEAVRIELLSGDHETEKIEPVWGAPPLSSESFSPVAPLKRKIFESEATVT